MRLQEYGVMRLNIAVKLDIKQMQMMFCKSVPLTNLKNKQSVNLSGVMASPSIFSMYMGFI